MKNIFFLIVLFLFFSCEKENKSKFISPKIIQDSVISKDKEVKLTNEEILKIQQEEDKERSQIVRKYILSKKGNGFEYKIFCEEEKSGMINFSKVNIFKSGKFFQQLKIDKDSTFVYHDYEVDFSCDEDWNFDGYNDFTLINWVGMVDQSYYLWLYDKNSKKYKFSPSFGKIKNPVADKKNKQITSSYHIGSTYYLEIYKFKKGKYLQTYSEVKGEGD